MAKPKLFDAPKILIQQEAKPIELADLPGGDEEEVQEEPQSQEEEAAQTKEEAGEEEAPKEEAEAAAGSEEAGEEAAEEEPAVDDELLRLAESHGFTASEAKQYSPDMLTRAIAAIDRQAAEWGKLQRKQAPPATESAQQEPPKKIETKLPEKLKLQIKDDWDEDVAKTLTAINDHYDGVIRSQAEKLAAQEEQFKTLTDAVLFLHSSQTEQTGHQQAEELTREERELDEFFAGLGEEFVDVYGKLPIRQLPEGSAQRKARVQFYEEFDGLRYAEKHRNRQTSTKDLLERTRILLHPDKIKAAARKEIAGKLAARKSQQTPKPSGKKASPLTGEEAAIKRWTPFQDKVGKILEQSVF